MTPQRRPDRVRGPEHDRFWASCDAGRMKLQRCEACSRFAWPPTEACRHCGGQALDWRPVSGRAKLVAWCSFEKDYYGGVLPMPCDTILVELEEGPLFISNPLGFGEDDMRAGMALRLVFVDCDDSAGAFRLPVFERA